MASTVDPELKNTSNISVMVVGSSGKMGAMACNALRQDPQVSIVYPITRQQPLEEAVREYQPSIILELTHKDAVFENTNIAIANSIPTIVGASGLTEVQKQSLDVLSQKKQTPLLVVPNFSVAAVLMIRAARMTAAWLSDCEIIEYHHSQKKDAPSATSLHTADAVCDVVLPKKAEKNKRSSGYLHRNQVPIHSIRAPGYVAKQDVIFSQSGETLTLSLSQIDRCAFMPGVLLAVHRVCSLKNGLHVGLDAILDSPAVQSSGHSVISTR